MTSFLPRSPRKYLLRLMLNLLSLPMLTSRLLLALMILHRLSCSSKKMLHYLLANVYKLKNNAHMTRKNRSNLPRLSRNLKLWPRSSTVSASLKQRSAIAREETLCALTAATDITFTWLNLKSLMLTLTRCIQSLSSIKSKWRTSNWMCCQINQLIWLSGVYLITTMIFGAPSVMITLISATTSLTKVVLR